LRFQSGVRRIMKFYRVIGVRGESILPENLTVMPTVGAKGYASSLTTAVLT